MQMVFGVSLTGSSVECSLPVHLIGAKCQAANQTADAVTTTSPNSLQAGSHPLNKNLDPSVLKLSFIMPITPPLLLSPCFIFMIRLLITSEGAQIVVATVPDIAEEIKWRGIPFSSDVWAMRRSLKKSYETS